MKIPEKIYLNIPKEEVKSPLDSTTWDTREFDDCINVEYIRKDALLEWVREELGNTSILRSERIETLQQVIDKLKSM